MKSTTWHELSLVSLGVSRSFISPANEASGFVWSVYRHFRVFKTFTPSKL